MMVVQLLLSTIVYNDLIIFRRQLSVLVCRTTPIGARSIVDIVGQLGLLINFVMPWNTLHRGFTMIRTCQGLSTLSLRLGHKYC